MTRSKGETQGRGFLNWFAEHLLHAKTATTAPAPNGTSRTQQSGATNAIGHVDEQRGQATAWLAMILRHVSLAHAP
jgi:hypothetical protein